MKQYLETHIQIALALLVLALAVAMGAFVADRNQEKIEASIRAELEDQRTYMLTLAEITDRNGADEATATILKDCERRVEFESLLVKLGSLTKKDLVLVQSLFQGCGDFYSVQKALMAAKLEREFETYRDLLVLLRTLTESDTEKYEESAWEDIVANEKFRGALLADLTGIQGRIISELISGSSVQGAKVSALVTEAQDIGQLLIVYDRKADEGREAVKD
jgi:hypothetical protein